MIKGQQKQEQLPYKDVLQRTSGGYDIYMFYEGKVSKRMKRPWGTDNHPSFGIFQRGMVWFWKDLATEESGSPAEYVMKKYGLNFKGAMDKILFDFGWSTKEKNASPVKITWERKKMEIPVHISFTSQPFKKGHHEFWNAVEVQEEDCKKLECWAIKDLAIKRKRFTLAKDEIAFAYYAPEEDKVKIYLPERDKEFRFYNNVSHFYLWNLRNITKCEKIVVQKSYKDLIVTTMLTPYVTATNSEAFEIFNEETVEIINDIADEVFMAYGSDPHGTETSIRITKAFGWKWCNTPKKYLPEINDYYGLVKAHGMKELERLLKSKKVI